MPPGVRTDHLPRFLLDALDDHLTRFGGPEGDAPLFPGEQGGPMSPVWHQKHWTRARDMVGAPDVHFHDLRHTAGTLAAQHGATLAELKRLLGHSSVRAALRYQHAAEGRLKAIAERVGAEVEAELSRGFRGVQPPPPPGLLRQHHI